jgi:hypothetical protein
MQDEELDKLINDAASQHHPPYDDKAWGKMEQLLDKHLLKKKDWKRPFIFLLGFLLLGSAVIWGTLHLWKNNTTVTTTTNEVRPGAGPNKNFTDTASTKTANAVTGNTAIIALPKQKINLAATGNAGGIISKVPALLPALAKEQQKNTTQAFSNNNNKVYKQKARFAVKVKKPVTAYNDAEVVQQKNKPPQKSDDATTIDEATKENAATNSPVDILIEEKKDAATTLKTDNTNTNNNITAVKEKTATNKKATGQQKKKTDKSFTSNFALTVAAGADVSYVSINNTGKLQPVYGTGLSYAIGKHFAISSGLYISKKIYTAAPNQYKTASGNTNPNLINISGSCKIYDIPLTVYYNFKQVKNHNWFGSLGISSFLMKKETYNYKYKNPATGQLWSYLKSISNENEHYFSVVTLSAGYKYTLNSRFSIFAEPYLKLPLTGVGLGKVKLNSTGLLFTAAVKPFAKNKK